MRIIIRCLLKISMILFLLVGCGYNLYYWERFSKKNATHQRVTTTTNEDDYYQEPLYDDTLTNDTIEEFYPRY